MITLLRNGMPASRSNSRRDCVVAARPATTIAPRHASRQQPERNRLSSRRKPGPISATTRMWTGGSRLSPGRHLLRRFQFCPVVRADEVADLGIGLVLPATAVEDAVMTDAQLQVMGLRRRRQIAAQAMRRHGLANRADIVAFAFDRHQRGVGDRAGVDRLAAPLKAALRQILALKHAVDRLE